MTYDSSKDPHSTVGEALLANGALGVAVAPDDDTDLEIYVKAIVLLTAGNVSYLPVKAADDAPLSFEGLPAGWISPHRVRRVLDTGTTASVATVQD